MAQIAAPISALFLLGPGDYGRFSIVYLLFAWAISLQLSVVCEPYARSTATDGAVASLRDYLGVSSMLATAAGVTAGIVSAFLWRDALIAALAGTSILLAGFRAGCRYHQVLTLGLKGARAGDAALVAVFAAALAALDGHVQVIVALLAAWAAGSLAAVLTSARPGVPTPSLVRSWWRGHASTIRPLIKDSVVLDISSIGAPFMVAPFLGYSDFGIYRAVSSAAAPVRVVLEAVRPLVAQATSPAGRRRWLVISGALGALAGAAAAGAILVIDAFGIEAGVFAFLAPYAWWTGAFTGFSVVSAIGYYIARVHSSPAQLWRGRLLQSGSALLLPLVGAAAGGLGAAIACYVLATFAGAVVWAHLILTNAETPPPE